VVKQLKQFDIRAEVDDRNEKVGRKIRDNELKRIPYLLIVGEKEAEDEAVSVRKQGGEDKGTINLLTFAEEISREVEEMMNPA
jgi:threonyl-tRNA synthetase